MSDAEAYLRRGKKIQSEKFGRTGVAREDSSTSDINEAGKAMRHSGEDSIVILKINDTHRETCQLPMKKKAKKCGHGESGSDKTSEEEPQNASSSLLVSNNNTKKASEATAKSESVCDKTANDAVDAASTTREEQEDALELADVASPSSPMPQVEGVAQRISLLSKWFPAALQEGRLEAAVSPSPDFVEATVERMNRARDYVLALRYGVEDVEVLLKDTRDTQWRLWEDTKGNTDDKAEGEDARKRYYWQLPGKSIAKLVKVSGAGLFKEALSEFADEVPSTAAEVTVAIRAMVRRRRHLSVPLEYSPKGWKDILNTRGPEAGYVPHLSDVLWLSVASATAMFSVVAQHLLRSARALAEKSNSNHVDHDLEPGDKAEGNSEEGNENDAEDRPRFFDNTTVPSDSDTDNASQNAEAHIWIACSLFRFQENLTAEEKSLLAFLRYLMPIREEEENANGAAPQGRTSTGLGVWLYAAFTTLDAPLDPDTARLAHNLFRTCCRHLRTLSMWKGVRGSTRNLLLKEFPSRQKGTKATYVSLEEIAREDVLALYTIVVVLARFFRQNQDHFILL